MRRLRIGDTVKVLVGKDKGKTGTVRAFVKKGEYVVVEGINLVTKFIKKGMLGDNKEGGKVKIEAPIHKSNVMVVCPACGKPTRVGVITDNGKKFRVCKRCGHKLDAKTPAKVPAQSKKRVAKTTKAESKI